MLDPVDQDRPRGGQGAPCLAPRADEPAVPALEANAKEATVEEENRAHVPAPLGKLAALYGVGVSE
eukprot:2273407-Alexandrium_andersonii.AAC.1